MIQVQRIDPTNFEVTAQGRATTTHRVTLSAEYHCIPRIQAFNGSFPSL